jgi:hypothetical protein
MPAGLPEDVPEKRPVFTLLATSQPSDDVILKFSLYNKLIRVIAYCRRFIHNCRPSSECLNQSISSRELEEAAQTCIRIAQHVTYYREITALRQNQPLSRKRTILSLNPFVDQKGILRVGGRLNSSDLNFESKHQIILSPHRHLTKLLISTEHTKLLHARTQLVLASLRTEYWIPRARQTIRSVIHKYLPCFRLKANSTHPLMGQLPSDTAIFDN